MKNKLSQEYKDDLYEKVLEKKRQRTLRRKKMLSIFIVFVSVVGFTILGFSLLGQDDYCNFFTSETENIMIEDEYQYFDDLGIKLEFINIDDNSLTLGINIKYEDIAEHDFEFEEITAKTSNDVILIDSVIELLEENKIKNRILDLKVNNKSEVVYIIKYEMNENINKDIKEITIRNIIVKKYENKECEKIEIDFKKEISIED